MKKLKLLFMSILLLSMILAGCSSKGTDNSGSSDAQKEKGKSSAENMTIEVRAHPAYSIKSSDPKRVEYIKSQIDKFESANEGVTVKNEALSSNISEAMAKLLEQAAQGRAPEVAQIDSYIFPRYYEYLQPLDPYLEEHGISADDFFPFAQNVMKGPDGKIYGLQFTTDTRVLFYRKDLVQTPPKTWDDVLQIGEKLKGEGYDTLLYPAGRGEGAIVTSVLPQFWGQGGKLVDEEGNPVFGEGENREAMLNVLNFVKESVDKGITPKRVANYGAENDLNAEFASGKVAMFLGGNWQASQVKNILGEEEFDKWEVAPLPQKAGAENKTTAGGWAWGVFTKDEAKAKAAVDFLIDAFVGDEGMANWTTIGGYLPTRESVYESPKYETNKFTETFKQHLKDYAQMRPSAEVYPEISAQLQIAISSVASGGKSPEEALDQAWEAVQ